MSCGDPPQVPLSTGRFFEQLTWSALEKRIRAALDNPHAAVPLQTHCPAVRDLAQQILAGIAASALQRPGEVVASAEVLSYDQRLVVLRILEAVISEYENWQPPEYRLRFAAETHSVFDPRLDDLRNS